MTPGNDRADPDNQEFETLLSELYDEEFDDILAELIGGAADQPVSAEREIWDGSNED